MKKQKPSNFELELAKMASVILRNVARRQEAIFTRMNLAISHIVILELLRDRGTCRMSDLAKTLNMTMSAVTAIVDKMIEQSLVKRERSKQDRRIVNVSLLKKGKKLARSVNESRIKLIGSIYSVLNQKEKETYLKLLRKVYNYLMKK